MQEYADILDNIEVSLYGPHRELAEEEKDTLRQMVLVMRERRSREEKSFVPKLGTK